tara:strand:+ start:829 stop:1800 length:972 start_codon:yes stop_codon:yes gene_type:complete
METETIIYEDVDAINNSSLGYFKKSPHHFHKYITKQLSLESNADYFKIGTAVHCALLEEGKFEEDYILGESPRVDGIVGKFIDKLIDILNNNDFQYTHIDNLDERYLKLAYSDLGTTWKYETVVSKFKESKNYNYFDFVMMNLNKIVLSPLEWEIVFSCVRSVRENKHANTLLSSDYAKTEMEIYWTKYNLDLKSKLDLVIYDDFQKVLYVVDVKTTSKPLAQFINSYEFFDYYRQMAFYIDAAINYRPYSIDWKIQPYFIVVETKDFHQCKVFDVDPADIEKGRSEYTDMLLKIAWHTKEDKWKYDKEYYTDEKIEILSLSK